MRKLNCPNWYSFTLLLLFVAYTLTSSCISVKKTKYLNDLPDTMSVPYVINQPTPFVDPTIESNDNLAVTVQTITQNATSTPITTNSLGTFSELNGNLVDKNGIIEIPLIGKIKVGGLTTAEARELIRLKAKEFYKDPVVNVRISNFNILMLGDVGRPGAINMPSEKVSIIDAIALAGDLPLTAKKTNILLIRSEGDEKKFVRFDLTSKSIYQSPYFYLKQRDIIYVEPSKGKVQGSDNSFIRNLGILSSIISLASLALVFRSIK
jgi:polysaccharide export outer membrane protein